MYQHVQYFPFGETFVEERTGTSYTPYLYNGKELDEETGLYYYHARYYDPRMSMFYGVDPLTEKNHSNTPYSYAANNPIKYVDWMGMDTLLVDQSGRFSQTVLPDDENNDIVVRVSSRERNRGEINYRRDGSLRRRHKNFETEKNAFQINRRGIETPDGHLEGVMLGNFKTPEAAWETFKALVEITSVEWSYVAKLDSDFDLHINMFTSHRATTETFGASMTLHWHERNEFTVISHIHNHPGRAQNVLMPSSYDIDFRNRLMQHGPLLFGIYNRGVLRGYEFD